MSDQEPARDPGVRGVHTPAPGTVIGANGFVLTATLTERAGRTGTISFVTGGVVREVR